MDPDGQEGPEDGDEGGAAEPEAGSGGPILPGLKPAKKAGIGSLQSPADSDAGYGAHKGKGHHVQLVETRSPSRRPTGPIRR